MHKTIEPSILYFGTPVVLISTRNEDGTRHCEMVLSVDSEGIVHPARFSAKNLRRSQGALQIPPLRFGRDDKVSGMAQVGVVNGMGRTASRSTALPRISRLDPWR
jgi:hypothetical protein